jgi:single-strand DNA-binding protein
MVNHAILVGNVGGEVEIHTFDNGDKKATFSLATSETYKTRDGEKKTTTEWHNIVCYRGLATLAENWIGVGSQLFVDGKIHYRSYTDKDGNKRGTTDIVAENIRLLSSKDGAAKSTENRQNEGTGKAKTGSDQSLPDPDNVREVAEEDSDLPF